jgi:hypothetical protein
MFAVGLLLTSLLVLGPLEVGAVTLDLSALVYSAALVVIGAQAVTFALFTKVYAVAKGFLPPDDRIDRLGARFRLERGLLLGVGVLIAGAVIAVWSFWRWRNEGWGNLDPTDQLRIVVPAALGLILGSWTVLASFFLSILGMDKQVELG